MRRYLLARSDDDPTGPVRLYVVESIRAAKVTKAAFVRDPDFNLQAFANRAFGVFQNEEEFGEVVWRFSPTAAAHARGFEFHPTQVLEDQPDGSLIVRFSASDFAGRASEPRQGLVNRLKVSYAHYHARLVAVAPLVICTTN